MEDLSSDIACNRQEINRLTNRKIYFLSNHVMSFEWICFQFILQFSFF